MAFALYAVASLALFYRPGLFAGTHDLGNGTDPYLYIWSFYFIPHAIAHGHNPFVIPLAWAPAGLNITQATTTPGLALLFWPLTAWAGPVVSFNVASLAAPALGATTAFLFAYVLTGRAVAAFIAGWIFGFSTYVAGALLGHLQTDFVPLVPLAFLVVALRGRGRLSALPFVLLLSMIDIGQFLISLETFVTTAIFLGLFLVVQEAAAPGGLSRARWHPAGINIGLFALCYVITAAMLAPYFYYFFSDYAQIPHVLQNGGYFCIDLLNFIIPTPVTWLGGHLFLPITNRFSGGLSEDLGYIGLPLAILTAIAVGRTWRVRQALPLIVILVVACIFALGPVLRIDGQPIMRLPWTGMQRLPLLANVVTGRLMVYAVLGIGIVCAIWLSRLQRGYFAGCAVVAAAALLTLPNSIAGPNTGWYDPLPKTQFFQTGAYRQEIARGETVMFLPFQAANGDAIIWQTLTRGYFRTIDGYGNFIPPLYAAWPAAQMLNEDAAGPDFAPQFNLFMKHFSVSKVLVPQALWTTWGPALAEAGWRRQVEGTVAIYDMAPASWAKIPDVTVTAAQEAFDENHLRALTQAASCMLAKRATQLDPDAAVASGCLDPAFRAEPGPPTNWDRLAGWLGFFGGKIGVAVTTDGAVAKLIAAHAGPGVTQIYFPYPRLYDTVTIKNGETGELIFVYGRRTLMPAGAVDHT